VRVKKTSVMKEGRLRFRRHLAPPEFTGPEAAKKAASFRTFTTGSPVLDGLLGGGFREGRIVEVLGRSNSGKTQLAMQSALLASRQGKKVLFVDTEGSFRPERVEEMATSRGWDAAGLLRRIVWVRTDSYAEQMEITARMRNREATAACSMVVVDTLTRNFTIGLPGRPNLAERQGALARYLSEASRDAFLNSRAYLMTNRVTFGQTRDVAIGGRTVEQMVHESVLLERTAGVVKATRLSTGDCARTAIGASGVE